MKRVGKILFLFLTIVFLTIVFVACNSDVHTHKWGSWYDNGDGTHMRMCLTDSEHIEYADHIFSDYEIKVEATDIFPGEKTRKCLQCGYTETEVISPIGNHIFDREIVDEKYLYEKTSDYSAIYYKSCECGAFGNPNCLFEDSLLPEGYSDLEYIRLTDYKGIDTGLKYSSDIVVKYNECKIKDIELPDDYIKIDYIEGTGTQWIDTNVSAIGGIRTEFTASWSSFGGYMVGSHALHDPYNRNGVEVHADGSWELGYGNKFPHSGIASLNRVYNIDFSTTFENAYLNIDGETIISTSGENLTEDLNVFLFSSQYQGASCTIGKMYSCKIYDNVDSLVRSFVPCYRILDNVVGMYDTVEGKFYHSCGPEEFTCGNEITRETPIFLDEFYETYTLLDYIESTGAQQIDTGIYFNPDIDSFEVTYKSSRLGQNGMILASKIANKYLWFYNYSDNNNFAIYTLSGMNQLSIDAGPLDTKVHKAIYQSKTLFIDGINKGSIDGETGLSSEPLYICSWNNDYFFSGRIYELKLFKDGNIVRWYFPVLRNVDGKAGLYDVVSGDFFSSSGSDFLPGNLVIVPENIIVGYSYGSLLTNIYLGKIYDMIIENGDNIIHLIPALRNSDGVIGMYDITNGIFYNSDNKGINSSSCVTHSLDDYKILKEATYSEDGRSVRECKICGAEIYEVIPKLSYSVDFNYDDGVKEIKAQKLDDPNVFEASNKAYSKNMFSYNYSKMNAIVIFKVNLLEGYEIEKMNIENGFAKIQMEDDTFVITNIVEDIKLSIKTRKIQE